jgi:hypothetical protein
MMENPGKTWGIIVLIIGILFLLVDLGVWNFIGIQWWTVLFVLFGICWTFMPEKKK